MSSTAPSRDETAASAAVSNRRLVCFLLGDQEYAVNIEQVREVTEALEVLPIPQAPVFIRGIITIRGRVLVLVDLHALFDVPGRARNEAACRHVVIEHRGYVFAIEVDTMVPLRWLPMDASLDAAPTGADAKGSYLEGILIHEDRPVMLLDVDKIADNPHLQAALASSRDQQLRTPFSFGGHEARGPEGDSGGAERGLVCFRLGNEEYAVPIEKGQEVVAPLPVTYIPFGPPFLRGVVNLRGSILPLLDLRALLSLRSGEGPAGEGRHLVVADERGAVAIEVDAVARLRRVRPEAIEEVPPSMARDEAAYLEGVIPDEVRPVLLLDWNKIMNHEAIVRLRGRARPAGGGG